MGNNVYLKENKKTCLASSLKVSTDDSHISTTAGSQTSLLLFSPPTSDEECLATREKNRCSLTSLWSASAAAARALKKSSFLCLETEEVLFKLSSSNEMQINDAELTDDETNADVICHLWPGQKCCPVVISLGRSGIQFSLDLGLANMSDKSLQKERGILSAHFSWEVKRSIQMSEAVISQFLAAFFIKIFHCMFLGQSPLGWLISCWAIGIFDRHSSNSHGFRSEKKKYLCEDLR